MKTQDRLVVWIALLAGGVWMLSGAVNSALTWSSRIPESLTNIVFPSTISPAAWHAVAPWPAILAVASALTLAAIFAVASTIALAAKTTPRVTFVLLWFCAILASFATNVVWSVGEILAGWPPARFAMLLNGAQDTVLRAGYWGIVWGWLPAVVAIFLLRRHEPSMAGIRVRAGTTAVAIVAAVALVVSLPLSTAANRGATAQLQPSPAPSTPTVVYGSPTVAAAVESPGDNWCGGDQVAVTVGQTDAATGHRRLDIRLVNTGERSCVVDGYPDVAFDDTSGSAMETLMVHGGSFMTTDARRQPITLAPNAAAQASLGWNAMAPAGSTTVGTILVAPYAGAVRQKSSAALDIVNGGAVAVTAWEVASR